jgi:hypothetical protein
MSALKENRYGKSQVPLCGLARTFARVSANEFAEE